MNIFKEVPASEIMITLFLLSCIYNLGCSSPSCYPSNILPKNRLTLASASPFLRSTADLVPGYFSNASFCRCFGESRLVGFSRRTL